MRSECVNERIEPLATTENPMLMNIIEYFASIEDIPQGSFQVLGGQRRYREVCGDSNLGRVETSAG
jgi:hypothetical protein